MKTDSIENVKIKDHMYCQNQFLLCHENMVVDIEVDSKDYELIQQFVTK